jgi:hypothetical protein
MTEGTPRNKRAGLRFSGDLPDRIHRLFACALCRRVPALVEYPALLEILETSEAFADGRATTEDLLRASERAEEIAGHYTLTTDQHLLARVVGMSAALESPSELSPWTINPFMAGNVSGYVCRLLGLDALAERHAGTVYPPLFDDVEPRPVPFSPSWRTATALALARQMYKSREFSAMPILADALQDAGCDSDDVLNHCRGPGPHVRGCWVVDLVLEKE